MKASNLRLFFSSLPAFDCNSQQAHRQSLRGQTCVIFKAVIISWHPMTTTTTTTTTTATSTIMPIKRNQQLNTENGLWTQNVSEDDISALLTWMAGGTTSLKVVMKKYFTSRPGIDFQQQPQNFWNFSASDQLWVGLEIIQKFSRSKLESEKPAKN